MNVMTMNTEYYPEEFDTENLTQEDLWTAEDLLRMAEERMDATEKEMRGFAGMVAESNFLLQKAAGFKQINPLETEALLKTIRIGMKAEVILENQEEDLPDYDELTKKVRDGENAMEALVLGYQRLVYSIVDVLIHIALCSDSISQNAADILQEANIGLIKAAKNYESSQSAKFSTYAVHWIRGAVVQAIKKQNTTRCLKIPRKVYESMVKIQRMAEHTDSLTLKKMTYGNISAETGLTIRQVSAAMMALYRTAPDCSYLPPLANSDHERININWTTGQMDGTTQECEDWYDADMSQGEEALSPYLIARRREVRETLRQVMSVLPENQRRIIELQYGLDDDDASNGGMSYSEISKIIGISPQGVRQLADRALWTLRSASRLRKICDTSGISSADEILTKEARRYGELYTAYAVKRNNLKVDARKAAEVFRGRYIGTDSFTSAN